MLKFDAVNLSDGDFDQILSFLRSGGVIGFPTDTAYGLGADPFQESAIRRIFEIKGRPESKPILVLVDSMDMLQQIVDCSNVSDIANLLGQSILAWTTDHDPSGIRNCTTPRYGWIGHHRRAVARCRFCDATGSRIWPPVTATSANKSGQPSTAAADEVRSQLGMDLEMLIDGGVLSAPQGSTVIDLTQKRPTIVREGPVSRMALAEALNGNIQ